MVESHLSAILALNHLTVSEKKKLFYGGTINGVSRHANGATTTAFL